MQVWFALVHWRELEKQMSELRSLHSFNLHYVFIDGKRHVFVFLTENRYGLKFVGVIE